MTSLEPPNSELWRRRAAWFRRAHDANAGPRPLDLDPHAALLLDELEVVFCAGAWAATIIVAWSIVEGERRAAERRGLDIHDAPDVDWLREQRNRLAHVDDDAAAPPPDEEALEGAAQGAVRVAFKTLFSGAWVRGERR